MVASAASREGLRGHRTSCLRRARPRLGKRQERCFLIDPESEDLVSVGSQQCLDVHRGAVAAPNPNDFWRRTPQEAHLVEVRVLRENRETSVPGVGPYCGVGRSGQTDVANVDGSRKHVRKGGDETRRDVLVKEEFHPGGIETSLRSRAAANARAARMSSGSRSGRSARISASVIPEARYSRTSCTVIRSPRMHGFPPLLPGSSVMRSKWSMPKNTRRPDGRSNFADGCSIVIPDRRDLRNIGRRACATPPAERVPERSWRTRSAGADGSPQDRGARIRRGP